jgi:hypothetical protein
VEERFTPLFRSTLIDWQMAGNGRFNVIDGGVLESEGGPGPSPLGNTQRRAGERLRGE